MLWILEHIDQLNTDAVLSLLPRLSESRRARVRSVTHVPSKVRSILAELLLRHALRAEYGLTELPRIETGEKGKPFFPDHPELHFNLSHCQTAVACAVDTSPVGVDVEACGRLCRGGTLTSASSELSRGGGHQPPATLAILRVLSEPERQWVEQGKTPEEQDRRFTAVWTCKEAWGKAAGQGLLYDLRSTDFRPKTRPWLQYGCVFRQLDLGNTLLTLCSAAPLRLHRIGASRLFTFFQEETP